MHVKNNDDGAAGTAAVRHRSGPVPDRAAAQPRRLRVGAPLRQCLDMPAVEAARAVAAGGEGQPRQWPSRMRPGRSGSTRKIPARSRSAALEIAQATRDRGAQQGAGRRGRPAQGAGDRRRERRQERAAAQRPRGDREGRARSRAHPGASPRRAALVTDLRTDVGHFAQAGAPAMTLIADPRPVDQRRHDREQPRQHRARRRGRDRSRRDARPRC